MFRTAQQNEQIRTANDRIMTAGQEVLALAQVILDKVKEAKTTMQQYPSTVEEACSTRVMCTLDFIVYIKSQMQNSLQLMKDKPEYSAKALEVCKKLIEQLKEHLSILPSECEKIGAANEQFFCVSSQAVQLAVKNYLKALSIMQAATDEHQSVIVASQIQLQDPLLKESLLVRRKVEISVNLVNMAQTQFQTMMEQTKNAIYKIAHATLEKLKIETTKAIEEVESTNSKIQKEATEALAKVSSISNIPNFLPHFNGVQSVSTSAASPAISQAETGKANSATAKMSGKHG